MNKVVEELKKAGAFFISSIDGNQPRVRPFGSILEFEGNVYICSGKFKEFYKQISNNPNVEICAIFPDYSWIRVSATLEEDCRLCVQEAMLNDETGHKGLYTAGDGRFVTFKLTNVRATKFSFSSAPVIIE